MSGTFPTSPSFKSTRPASNQPTIVSMSESAKRQSRIIAGHLWGLTADFPPMTRAEFAPIMAFVLQQRGRLGSFQITLPQFNTPQGIATGTPLVVGAHSVGDSTIVIDGWTASQTGIMKGLDFIKFSSHDKVYAHTADCNSDGGGQATHSIFPPLINALADNEAVTVNSVPFTMAFENDVQEFKTENPNIYKYSIDLIESL